MDMKDLISQEIRHTITEYSSRRTVLSPWRDPLVGVASASDPLFAHLRRVAHPGHFLPSDLLDGAQSVIAFFLPFTRSIPASNARGSLPSRAWAKAYIETNGLIELINDHLSDILGSRGYRASTVPATHNFDPISLVSAWSHRHAAYIAGLGTFGLHGLLITEMGCCGRLGSIMTDLEVAPTLRPEGEACLSRFNGSCTACTARCVGNALKADGFDRQACYRVLLENEARMSLPGRADVCGKCICGVPCSVENPVKRLMVRQGKI